ncbi:hypothetical protein GEMRC1_006524 [Eukaryota sp. GEM-RC1]
MSEKILLLESAMSEYDLEKSNLLLENDSLKNNGLEKEAVLKQKIDFLTSEIQSLNSSQSGELEELNNQLVESQSENVKLQSNLDELTTEFLALNQLFISTKNSLSSKVSELEDENQKLSKNISELMDENECGLSQVSERFMETVSHAESVEQQLDDALEENEVLKEEGNQMRDQLNQLQSDYDGLEEKYTSEIGALQSKLEDTLRSVNEAESRYENSEAAYSAISMEYKDFRIEQEQVLSEKNDQLSKISNILDGINAEHDVEVCRLKNEFEDSRVFSFGKESTIADLQSEIYDLQEEISKLSNHNEQMLSENADLMESKSLLIDSHASEADELNSEIDVLKMEVEQLKVLNYSERSELETKCHELFSEVKRLHQTNVDLESASNEVLRIKEELASKLVQKDEYLDEVSEENSKLKKTFSAMENRIEELNSVLNLKDLNNAEDLAELADENVSLKEELAELEKISEFNLSQRDLKIAELSASFADVNTELEYAKQQLEVLKREKSANLETIAQHHLLIQNFPIYSMRSPVMYNASFSENSSLSNSLSEVSAEVEELRVLNEEKVYENNELVSKYHDLVSYCGQLVSLAKNSLNGQLNSSDCHYDFEPLVSSLNQLYKWNSESYAQLHDEAATYLSTCIELRKDREVLSESANKKEAEIEELKVKVSELKHLCERLNSEKKSVEVKFEVLEQKLKFVNTNLDEEKRLLSDNYSLQHKALATELQKLSDKYLELQEINSDYVTKIDQLSDEKAKFEDYLNQLTSSHQSELESASQQQAHLESELEELRSSLSLAENEKDHLEARLTKKISDVQSKLMEATNLRDTEKVSFELRVSSLEKSISHYKSVIEELLSKLRTLNSNSSLDKESLLQKTVQLKTSLDERNQEIRQLLGKLDQSDESIRRLQTKVSHLETDNQQLLASVADLENLTSQNSDLSNRVLSLQSAISEKERELSESQEFSRNLKNTISKLELDLESKVDESVFNSVKNQLTSAKQKNADVVNQLSALSQQKCAMQDQITQLSRDLSVLRRSAVYRENERLQESLALLSNDLEAKTLEFVELRQKYTESTKLYESQLSDIENTSREIIQNFEKEIEDYKYELTQYKKEAFLLKETERRLSSQLMAKDKLVNEFESMSTKSTSDYAKDFVAFERLKSEYEQLRGRFEMTEARCKHLNSLCDSLKSKLDRS